MEIIVIIIIKITTYLIIKIKKKEKAGRNIQLMYLIIFNKIHNSISNSILVIIKVHWIMLVYNNLKMNKKYKIKKKSVLKIY